MPALALFHAIECAFDALRDTEQAEQTTIARDARDQTLPAGATGVSRLSTETERVGNTLYTYASLPFEIASLLLLVAIIGSVMLARTLKQEAAADDVDPDTLQTAAALESLEAKAGD